MSLVLSPLVVPVHHDDDDDDDYSREHDVMDTDSIPFLLDESSSFLKDHDDKAVLDSVLSTANDEHNDDDFEMQTMESTTTTTIQPPPFGGGLVNLGNTCYMNAAIQALASLNGFPETLLADEELELHGALRELLQSMQEHASTNPRQFKQLLDQQTSLFVGYRQQDAHEFLTTLIDLLDEEYKKSLPLDASVEQEEDDMDCNSSDSESETKLPPPTPPRIESFSRLQVDEIGHLLHGKRRRSSSTFCTVPVAPPPPCKLVGGQQQQQMQQPHGCTITGLLQRESPSSSSLSQHQEGDEEISTVAATCQDDVHAPVATSPVDELFTTRIRVTLRCDSCNYTRHSVETHRHLSLNVTDHIQDGIRAFLAPQSLELKCTECFADGATQSYKILSLPKALVLHIKRFMVQENTWTYVKNAARVEFDEPLSLSDGDDDDDGCHGNNNYQFKSVVHHVGSSVHCGHYTADAQRRGLYKKFNDDYVTDTTHSHMDKSTAYILFYEKKMEQA